MNKVNKEVVRYEVEKAVAKTMLISGALCLLAGYILRGSC